MDKRPKKQKQLLAAFFGGVCFWFFWSFPFVLFWFFVFCRTDY